ncbi:hypothetical protein SUGI_0550490 [Cryptomeria japonica]|nr:hypothetical protein SUGI_0550490 [Cryptomeria japonica]
MGDLSLSGKINCLVVQNHKDAKIIHDGPQNKIKKLYQSPGGLLNDLTYFEKPIRLPLEPTILLTRTLLSESFLFKSALHPLCLTFQTVADESRKSCSKRVITSDKINWTILESGQMSK